MKLSASNIAWDADADKRVYEHMVSNGFAGLEIAPTRIFDAQPYEDLASASDWAKTLMDTFGLSVSSMQSIWYGRPENIFESALSREALCDYTKRAICFAQAVGCSNLVFGCPKNRTIPDGMSTSEAEEIAARLFFELGEFAHAHGTKLSLEANPSIYGTNFINTTPQAIEMVERVGSRGFALNLDVGTMIQNGEDIEDIQNAREMLNHVHISEPKLAPIEERPLHGELLEWLDNIGYAGYVSIEMGNPGEDGSIIDAMGYLHKLVDAQ